MRSHCGHAKPKKPKTADLVAALRQFGKAIPTRPVGLWYTLDEMAAEDGVSRNAIRYRMLLARKQGIEVESAPGSIPDANGILKRTTFYRLKNGKH